MVFFSGYRCDEEDCGNFVTYKGGIGITHLRSLARKDGYTVGKRVLCPYHKRGGLTEEDRQRIAEDKRAERERIRKS